MKYIENIVAKMSNNKIQFLQALEVLKHKNLGFGLGKEANKPPKQIIQARDYHILDHQKFEKQLA